jgi:hypothetical protein
MNDALHDTDADDIIEIERCFRTMLGSHALAKACTDHFSYALKLSTGEHIFFDFAKPLAPDWVHLVGARISYNASPYDRGMDVRISAIVWVVDAPFGT